MCTQAQLVSSACGCTPTAIGLCLSPCPVASPLMAVAVPRCGVACPVAASSGAQFKFSAYGRYDRKLDLGLSSFAAEQKTLKSGNIFDSKMKRVAQQMPRTAPPEVPVHCTLTRAVKCGTQDPKAMQIRTRSIAGCKHECERHHAPGCPFDGHRMVCSLQPCDRTIKIVGSIERRFRYTSGTCKSVLSANTQTPCACANPLRPLPSPDLLAQPSRPRMLRECGLQVRKYWGRKLCRKTTRRRDSSKRPHPNELVLRSRYQHPKILSF